MSTHELARLFIRFQGAVFVFYGLVASSYIGSYYHAFDIVHATRELDNAATISFLGEVFRVAGHLVLALVLLTKTDWVISLFAPKPAPRSP
jgi:hypothetical protein